jgi:hypothetical protein
VPSRAKPGSNKDDSPNFFSTQKGITQRFTAENKQLPWQIERTWGFILRLLWLVFAPTVLYFLATFAAARDKSSLWVL